MNRTLLAVLLAGGLTAPALAIQQAEAERSTDPPVVIIPDVPNPRGIPVASPGAPRPDRKSVV